MVNDARGTGHPVNVEFAAGEPSTPSRPLPRERSCSLIMARTTGSARPSRTCRCCTLARWHDIGSHARGTQLPETRHALPAGLGSGSGAEVPTHEPAPALLT